VGITDFVHIWAQCYFCSYLFTNLIYWPKDTTNPRLLFSLKYEELIKDKFQSTSSPHRRMYEGVSKSFRIGRLERELQMVQLSATRCSFIAILWVSLVSFAAITFWRGQQRVIPKVSVYFVIDLVRKLLDTPSYKHSIFWKRYENLFQPIDMLIYETEIYKINSRLLDIYIWKYSQHFSRRRLYCSYKTTILFWTT
jgi:hypothetical protein